MSTSLKSICGQGLMHWKSETPQNVPITGVVATIDGILSKKEVSTLINDRLISNPSCFKFKSLITSAGYFKELKSFDSSKVLKVFKIKTKHSGNKIIDDDDIDTSSGSSSDSDNSINTDSEYVVLEQYLSTHIHKYHNYGFNKRHKLPLWRGHILQFINLNKTIFYFKCHHAICDGISLSKIFLSLADDFDQLHEQNTKQILKSKGFQQYQQRWTRPLLYILILIINCMLWLLDFCIMTLFHSEPTTIIRPKKANPKKSYSVLYNIPIAAINKARKTIPYKEKRVTVNDYLLTIISEGLSNFVADHDNMDGKLDKLIKAGTVISMNARDPLSLATKMEINCCVGVSNINLPLCTNKRLEFENKLDFIKYQMDNIKSKQFAMFSAYLLKLTGYFPRFMISFLLSLQNASIIVTNIRGPQQTLYLNGKEIINASGVVQNSPGISLSFCIAGYNGKCSISLLSDYNICGANTSQQIIKYIADVLKEKGCL